MAESFFRLIIVVMFEKRLIGMLGIATAFTICFYGIWRRKKSKIKYRSITFGNTGNKYRILLLSDLHIGSFIGNYYLSHIVQNINACQPDLIVIAGNIFTGQSIRKYQNIEKITETLYTLKSKDGVLAVCGNHDPSPDNILFRSFLTRSGITLLEDCFVTYDSLVIFGRKNNRRTSLSQILDFPQKNKFYIVIDHDFHGTSEAMEWGANLVLCGSSYYRHLFSPSSLSKTTYGKTRFSDKNRIFSAGSIVVSIDLIF